MQILTSASIKRRQNWIKKIKSMSGFQDGTQRIKLEVKNELAQTGIVALLDHLRLCGAIPEEYKSDSGEEKLYSKYTDVIVSESFQQLNLKSIVLDERGDAADVEVVGKNYDFVADAKVFRLSRTAKNAKDFKVQSMDGWRYGKEFAIIVAPIYQLPTRNSQIYMQSIDRNVLIFSFSHLALLVKYSQTSSAEKAANILHNILKLISTLHPSKSAQDYYIAINSLILKSSKHILDLWKEEKIAASEAVEYVKKEGLHYLSEERARILRLGHDEALQELVRIHRIDQKIDIINSVTDSGLFALEEDQ